MLKRYWCLIALVVVIVVGGVLFYHWYRYYHYSPIEGHTETARDAHSSDDYDHCYKQENADDVVLIIDAPGVRANDVATTLVNLNMMGNIDPTKPVVGTIVDDKPEPQDLGGGKIQLRFTDRHLHLGPGPYMVVATMPTTGEERKSGQMYKTLFFYYQTYDKEKGYSPSQCSLYRPDLSVEAPILLRPKIYARILKSDDMINGDGYRQHCFKRRDKADNVSIYFDVSGTGAKPERPVNITLDLYNLSDPDNVVLMDTVTKKFQQDEDTLELKESNSPPHLGPGPYMTILSSSPAFAGSSLKLDTTGYYYETWETELKECKRYSGH